MSNFVFWSAMILGVASLFWLAHRPVKTHGHNSERRARARHYE